MTSNAHSTGSAGFRSNVYRLGDSTKPLKSRKPRNPFRTLLERFCKLPPASRLRVMKILLAEQEVDAKASDQSAPAHPLRSDAAFFLKNGISRSLWIRYEQAQDEAWRLEWPGSANR